MKTIFTAFLLFVSLMIQAQTTYYIDPAGSDATGNGSADKPWKSLYKACVAVRTSGNIIHVNAGTYLETAQSSLAVGVSIEGEGITSIIKSRISAANTPTIVLTSGTQGTNGNQSISKIKMDGDALSAYSAIKITARSNVLIHDCTFIDFNNNGVIFNGGLSDGLPTTWATGNKFYNNIVTNCSKYVVGSEGRWALGMNGQDGMLVYNNTLTQTSRPAGNNGYLIKCVEGYNKGLKIHDNTLTRAVYSAGSYDFGMEFWNPLGGIEIYNNTLTNCDLDLGGVGSKGAYSYCYYVHDNTIALTALSDQGPQGIRIENSLSDVIIERNRVSNFPIGISFSQVNRSTVNNNIYIQYNIFENLGIVNGGLAPAGWGLYFHLDETYTHTFNNFNVWNNVFSGHTGGEVTRYGIMPPYIGTATNVSIRNNIVQGFYVAVQVGGGDIAGGQTMDYLSIENNIFYNNRTNGPVYTHITPTHNTTQNNYISNPKFVSSNDFHLQSGSIAINAGLELGLKSDYDGNPISGLPDIGVYEFINSDNRPPSIQDQGFQLNVNSPAGTAVGTVVASDPDAGQTLTYSILSGNTNGAFAIDALTGVLSVANSAALSFDFVLIVKVQDNGLGELSSQSTIAIEVVPTGIELTGKIETIKVYPNPVSDELIIEFKGNNERLIFNILNSVGQIVFEGKMSEKAVVQTTNFSPGIYLLKIENGRSFEFKKIVKV